MLQQPQTQRRRLLSNPKKDTEERCEQYVPSFIVSKSTSVMGSNKREQANLQTPLSTRGTIRQREQLSRYNDYSLEKHLITNNTKVSEDAFRHLQFLNMIERRAKQGTN